MLKESNSEEKNLAMALIQLRYGPSYSGVNVPSTRTETRRQQLLHCIQDLKRKLLMSRSENYLLRGFIKTANVVARKQNDVNDDDIYDLLKTLKGDYFMRDVSIQTTRIDPVTNNNHSDGSSNDQRRLFDAESERKMKTMISTTEYDAQQDNNKRKAVCAEERLKSVKSDLEMECDVHSPVAAKILPSNFETNSSWIDKNLYLSRLKMAPPSSTCSSLPVNLKQRRIEQNTADMLAQQMSERVELAELRGAFNETLDTSEDKPRLSLNVSPQHERPSAISPVSPPMPLITTDKTSSVSPDRLARCNICSHAFGSDKALKIHLAKKHKESQKKLDRSTVLNCPCGKVFETKWPQNCINKLKSHGSKCKTYLQNALNCEECGEKFIKLSSLHYHSLKKHNIPIPVPVDSR